MGCDVGVKPQQITDGTAFTVMLAELGRGFADADRRGTWAMGASGASSLWGHGVTDDQGPNNPNDLADDLVGCNDVKNAVGDAVLMNANMGCWDGLNWQATARSLHPGGVYVCFCDGHVTFISDFIDHNPNWSH